MARKPKTAGGEDRPSAGRAGSPLAVLFGGEDAALVSRVTSGPAVLELKRRLNSVEVLKPGGFDPVKEVRELRDS